jgi:hypothetical protein
MMKSLCRIIKGIPMAEMSPLARVLMGILQKGSWVAAGLLALFAGILLWQRYTPQGFAWQQGDKGFLGLLTVLFLLAVYLVRSIGKEVTDHTSSGDGNNS